MIIRAFLGRDSHAVSEASASGPPLSQGIPQQVGGNFILRTVVARGNFLDGVDQLGIGFESQGLGARQTQQALQALPDDQ